MNRSDHQVCAMAPRLLRALRPPSTARGFDGGKNLLTDGPVRQVEHLAQLARGQLGEPTLAVADNQIG